MVVPVCFTSECQNSIIERGERFVVASESQPKQSMYLKARCFFKAISVFLICLMFGGMITCSTPAIPYLNAAMLTEINKKLTEVPDGWIGIYSVEDLNNIRNYFLTDEYNASKLNFILMSDIAFTDADYAPGGVFEGGWVPISTEGHERRIYKETKAGFEYYDYRDGFDGTFNGNGYVIRNLKINNNDKNCKGLFGYTTATIVNLGIEGCEINVSSEIEDGSVIYTGAIAGKAEFIGCCYATDVSVNVNLNTSVFNEKVKADLQTWVEQQKNQLIFIGGLCGYVGYVDSCYTTDGDIKVGEKGNPAADLRVGGLAGSAISCVSSYFTGSISADEGKFYRCQTDPITVSDAGCGIPGHISQATLNKILGKSREFYGEESYSYKKITAYFLLNSPPDIPGDMFWPVPVLHIREYCYSEDVSNIDKWYIFDPFADTYEHMEVTQLIADAYSGYGSSLMKIK